jgi:hypothetical protein
MTHDPANAARLNATLALATLALEVAISAPARRHKHTPSATIPWDVVERIRAELPKLGIDWRQVKAGAEATS